MMFVVSFGYSLMANLFDGHLPIAEVTHSQLMDFGVHSTVRLIIVSVCFLKVGNTLLKHRYLEIFGKLKWIDAEVRNFF